MAWFIIFGSLLLVGAIISIASLVADDFDAFELGAGIGSIGLVLLVCALVSVAGIKSDFEAFKNNYQFTKQIVEDYEKGEDYGNTFDLTGQVLDINKKIAKHRAQWDSPWYNVWRCKEIGELEPLRLPNKRATN